MSQSVLVRALNGLLRRRPQAPARDLPGVIGRIHANDPMIYDESEKSVADYVRAAQSALENLETALTAARRDWKDVRSCLDFGSGYGRVLRYLSEKIPPSHITACDVDAEAVRFCVDEFQCKGLVSKPKTKRVRFRSYDLIWAGSVITHVQHADASEILSTLGHTLMPNGILVLSFHGRLSLNNLEHLYDAAWAEEATCIREEVAKVGTGFRPYSYAFCGYELGNYGMAWHTVKFLENLMASHFGDRIRTLCHIEHGWDNHHDVIAFQRL